MSEAKESRVNLTGSRLRESVIELASISRGLQSVAEAASLFSIGSRSQSEAVRQASENARYYAQRLILPEPGGLEDPIDGPSWRSLRQIDWSIVRLRRNLRGKLGRAPRLQRSWTYVGAALSIIAATMIVGGLWWGALTLLTLRAASSLLLGDEPAFPYEANDPANLRGGAVLRCLAGHFSDATLLLGVTFSLVLHGRTFWALASLLTLASMLFATLVRVAVVQEGVQVKRSALERVFRVTSMQVSLLGIAVTGGLRPEGTPWIAFALAGTAGYALAEVIWTLLRYRHFKATYGQMPIVVISRFVPPNSVRPMGSFTVLPGGKGSAATEQAQRAQAS